jgi:hypothetical protein
MELRKKSLESKERVEHIIKKWKEGVVRVEMAERKRRTWGLQVRGKD